MSGSYYLPVMLDMREKKILLVGGGAIASEKLGRLLDCTTQITVVSPACSEKMDEYISRHNLTLHSREFLDSDLDGVDIVIAAVDSAELQEHIFAEARGRGVLCNAVDLPSYCDFIFPSIVRRDDFILAVSTSGASPALSKYLKRFFESLIPDTISDFLSMMREKRDSLPKGRERMKMLDGLASEYMQSFARHVEKVLKKD